MVSSNHSECERGDDANSCGIRPWSYEEDIFRRRLKYFFMNSLDKFRAKKIVPFKVFLQIFKVFIVTYLLIDFGQIRSRHIDFIESSSEALKSFYLKDWKEPDSNDLNPSSLDELPYYTVPTFFEALNFIVERYQITEKIAIGNFDFASEDDIAGPLTVCIKSYARGNIYAFNSSFDFNSTIIIDCFPVPLNSSGEFDIEHFLEKTNRSINFDGLIRVTAEFSLKTVHLKSLRKSSDPDCYRFDIFIDFDNSNHNGRMDARLNVDIVDLQCHGYVLVDRGIDRSALMSWVTVFIVMTCCFFSALLCIRSFYRALKLQKQAIEFFEKYYPDKPLTFSDKLDFVDGWYILIILDNMLIICGCAFKISIELKATSNYEVCGLLLGTGNLFCWFGLLRYLAFFDAFKIFIVTLKKATPTVLKFLACAFFIFMGFSIGGWIVLGPYHAKFREFATATECLYSLMNGDDLYTTFAIMDKVSFGVWLYSRFYLFSFISLFIYVVMSMFITIIGDVYQTVKEGGDVHKSRLHIFADECTTDPDKLFTTQECKSVTSRILGCIRRAKSRSFESMVINEGESRESSSLLPSHTCTYYGV